MSKLYNTIFGINLPTLDEIISEIQASEQEQQVLGFIRFNLLSDGNIHINTEWSDSSIEFAEIYAKLLYQINTGNMEEGIINVLSKFGETNIKEQGFIIKVLSHLVELKDTYQNLPIISPSQVFKVQK